LTTKISIENYTPLQDFIEDFKLSMKNKTDPTSLKKEIKFVESKGLIFVKNNPIGAPQ